MTYYFDNGYDYFARMDHKYFYLQARISAQQSFMDPWLDVDLLMCHVEIMHEGGRYLFTGKTVGREASVRRKLFDNLPFRHAPFFLRASSVAWLGAYSDRYIHAGVYEIARRYAARGYIARLDEVPIVYDKNPTGLYDGNQPPQLRYFGPLRASANLSVC